MEAAKQILSSGPRNACFCPMLRTKQFSSVAYSRSTVHLHWPLWILLFFTVLGGCTRDPKILKQKFLKEGNLAFEQGKYPEASILYGRSLQEDPRFAEAHYHLALTQMKLGIWSYAAVELSRAIELQPDLW